MTEHRLPPVKHMSPEIREFIGRSHYCQSAVRELALMLPADETALDALIGEAVARTEDVEFIFLVMAVFAAGRKVQARHLARGTILMPETWTLGMVALHMEGDIATPLVEAVWTLKLNAAIVASALLLAAHWHEEHSGGKMPGPLVGATRVLETAVRENDLKTFMFVVVAALLRERKVEARHLAHGVGLIPDGIWMGLLAFHMEGDVAEPLMEGLRQRRVLREEAVTVFVLAAWCQEHRGGVLLEGFMTQARLQARMKTLEYNSFSLLLAVGLQTNDEGLQ